jgi:hypothetical protein
MYHLQLFNIDERGRAVGLVRTGDEYRFVSDACVAACRLRLRTRFRIIDTGGQLILEDALPPLNEAHAA